MYQTRVKGRFSGHTFNATRNRPLIVRHDPRREAREARQELIEGLAWSAGALAFVALLSAGFLWSATAPAARLIVTTESGHVYVAGEGDTCRDAWREAVIPADWESIVCH